MTDEQRAPRELIQARVRILLLESQVKELSKKLEERLNENIRLEKIIHKQQMEVVDIIQEHVTENEAEIAERDALIREAYTHIESVTLDHDWLKRAQEVLGDV